MLEVFDEMGRDLAGRWRDRGHKHTDFPQLAIDALRTHRPHEHADAGRIAEWVVRSAALPPQEDLAARFGQPPVTLYRDDRFSISVLYWVDGTTTIHQHSFCGAFGVLSGSSIHARYGFDPREVANEHLVLGELSRPELALLSRGDTHPIEAGSSFIHALFHLDRPTLSVVVRTHEPPGTRPQYDYYRPGLAVDVPGQPAALKRARQCLHTLMTTGHDRCTELVRTLLGRADAFETFIVLLTVATHDRGGPHLGPAIRAARKHHGELAEALEPALDEVRADVHLVNRRQALYDAEQRFLLALLLNVGDREEILRLVRERHPDRDPVDAVVAWLRSMHAAPVPTALGDASGNALGVHLEEADFRIVEGMLRGFDARQLDSLLAELGEEAPSPARIERLELMLPFNSVFGRLLGR